MIENLKTRKMSYAGHTMRNTSGHYYDNLLRTIEGRRAGKRGRGRPRWTWINDLRDWTGLKRYDQIKIAAERRDLHVTQQWINGILYVRKQTKFRYMHELYFPYDFVSVCSQSVAQFDLFPVAVGSKRSGSCMMYVMTETCILCQEQQEITHNERAMVLAAFIHK